MNSTEAFDQLCAHYGIAAGYHDIKGRERQVTDATRRALLEAMGVATGDAEIEQRSLQQAVDREWRRMLPPVVVCREAMPALELNLTLAEQTADSALRWVLREEDGNSRDGMVSLESLPGTERRVVDGTTWTKYPLKLPLPGQPGYHALELYAGADGARLAQSTIILAPRHCYLPEAMQGEGRVWGLSTQLHAIRSARNWGIGDFTDLTRLVEFSAEVGGGVLALNPLHALFPTQPERCNPYAPSSRLFLNILHIDVEAVPELAESLQAQAVLEEEDLQAQLRALRSASAVDYTRVAKLKLELLERLYRHFHEQHLTPQTPRGRAFQAFCEKQGEGLRRFALFESLREHFTANDQGADPNHWPVPYRRCDSPQVAEFAQRQSARLEFFCWLQWQAHQQLQSVGWRSLELRLALGLCQDLAVGVTADGADVWAEPELYIRDAHVGAPADDFSPKGQDWEVLAWHPKALYEAAYAPFIAALQANMREAGALRIDHVMGLMRLFLIPAGQSPAAGAYLAYPFQDLLGVLALESLRNRCLVIGEDLGTVPDAVRDALDPLGVLSFRLLYFERAEDGGFLAPEAYKRQAVVAAATHDLPTLTGFWQGTDLEQRRRLELFVDEHEYEQQLLQRNHDRAHLFLALDHAGLLPRHDGVDPVAVTRLTPEHIRAIHVYLARTPARLLLIQSADLLAQNEQVNLPGSGEAYPNWRYRQPLALENWSDDTAMTDLLAAVREERGISTRPEPLSEGGYSEKRSRASIPRATYRLQLHGRFGFAAAAELIPYLARLGISHCYFSPYLQARPGSSHGYDVIAHDRLNPELGSNQDFARLCETLSAHGMGQILDMVPNHVGVMGSDNRLWLDVLENGPASPFADFFDIDWEPLKQELRGKVLIPVLGDHYGNVLDSGELKLVFEQGGFRVQYYEHHFPVDPREYPRILAAGLPRLRERLEAQDPDLTAFESLVTAFGNLPARWRRDQEALIERRRDKELHKHRLAELCARNADLDWYLHECLRDYNGNEEYPANGNHLHELLEAQAFRLAHWRVAADEINYRRFFDINDLAALRMENPEAFEATHGLVLELIEQGRLSGLRIDHPDGLYDPLEYFRWLQQHVAARLRHAPWSDADPHLPLYLVVEKVLVGDEQLPAGWPVHGTTGYEFAALNDALQIDPQGEAPLSDCYAEFIGEVKPLAEEVYAAKRLVMQNLLSSELHVLASELSRIAEADPHTRDYTLDALRNALMQVVACFPVYRSYITADGVSNHDRNILLKALAEARRRSQAADLSVFSFLQQVLLTEIAEGKPDAYRARVLRLAMKFQQYTSPVTAKGLEDTALYRYHRLVSLNEVGGDPERFGVDIETYHRHNRRRRETWPHALLAGSTHDSKRSEDMRARLHLLSELPVEWREHVTRWARLNRRLRRELDGRTVPDANTEYLLYQSLLGFWPLHPVRGQELGALRERLLGYLDKAIKEAKVHTAWTNANAEYEAAVAAFTEAVLDFEHNGAFFDDFLPFQRRIARLGLFNSLSQTLLRLTAPGVPDLYQGCELWNFSLVDPDNRRAVDFELRRALLEGLQQGRAQHQGAQGLCRELVDKLPDGRAKLYLIQQALELRRADPELFEQGDYVPLRVEGPHQHRLCAFSRHCGGRSLVVLAPRLLAGLMPGPNPGRDAAYDPFADPGWDDTRIELPTAVLRDVLSDSELHAGHGQDRYLLSAAAVLRRFPVALLSGGGSITRGGQHHA